jgi:hypothetical protein
MERENPLNPPSPLSEEQLVALFKSIDAPAPSADFLARTMQTVKRAPLPAGRKALGHPLASLFGWAAVIGGVALSTLAVVLTHPIFASSFTKIFTYGVGIGVWLLQLSRTALALTDVFTTTGLAVARAAATREGTAGLVLMGVICALSLSALHRLLVSEWEESQWQELS